MRVQPPTNSGKRAGWVWDPKKNVIILVVTIASWVRGTPQCISDKKNSRAKPRKTKKLQEEMSYSKFYVCWFVSILPYNKDSNEAWKWTGYHCEGAFWAHLNLGTKCWMIPRRDNWQVWAKPITGYQEDQRLTSKTGVFPLLRGPKEQRFPTNRIFLGRK